MGTQLPLGDAGSAAASAPWWEIGGVTVVTLSGPFPLTPVFELLIDTVTGGMM